MVDIAGLISSNQYASNISAAENAYNIPSGLLGSLGYAESTLGQNGSGGNGGGWGQFTQGTWDQFGMGDINSQPDNINSSGAYLSYLYNKTGSWVSALQSYGTLPSGSLNYNDLNPAQQNVFDVANQADAGNAGYINPETGAPVNLGQLGGGGSLYNAGASAGNATSSALSTIANDFTSVLNWLKSISPTNVFIYIAVTILALVLLILGIADLAFGHKPAQIVRAVGSVAK